MTQQGNMPAAPNVLGGDDAHANSIHDNQQYGVSIVNELPPGEPGNSLFFADNIFANNGLGWAIINGLQL